MRDTIEDTLTLYRGRCGHQWVGASDGSYACPICGLHEGDHHLVSAEPIAVQVDDWGTAWADIQRLADERWKVGNA